MNVITVGNGFVANHLPYKIVSERVELNGSNIDFILSKYKPNVVINCIGFCGIPNVDQCEVEKNKTAQANTVVPTMLAAACDKNNIHFIHIGSGCIFYGNSPHKIYGRSELAPYNYFNQCTGWREDDFANPESYYSKTKFATDLLLGSLPNTSILRVRMPISTQNNPRNLLNKLIKYDQVIDIPNSVTFMDDFVRCVDWVINNKKTGIYHVTNPGTLTAAQIMNEYKKYVPEHKFKIINESELGSLTVAKRSNCLLNTEKLNNAGFKMTPADEALIQCMEKYVKNI